MTEQMDSGDSIIDVDPPEELQIPEQRDQKASRCCWYSNLNGVKFILFLDFIQLVITAIPFPIADGQEDNSKFAELFRFTLPFQFLSLMLGVMYLCRRCVLETGKIAEKHAITNYISSGFVLFYGATTIQILNVLVYYVVYSHHYLTVTRSIVVGLIAALYGLLRVYSNLLIVKHRSTLPVDVLSILKRGMVNQQSTEIGIILAMELLFALLMLLAAAWVGTGDFIVFKNVLFLVACLWWFSNLIVGFLLGVLSVFTHHRIVTVLFMIAYLFGTVQWCTITLLDISHSLPYIEPEDAQFRISENGMVKRLAVIIMYLYIVIRAYFMVTVYRYADYMFRGR